MNRDGGLDVFALGTCDAHRVDDIVDQRRGATRRPQQARFVDMGEALSEKESALRAST